MRRSGGPGRAAEGRDRCDGHFGAPACTSDNQIPRGACASCGCQDRGGPGQLSNPPGATLGLGRVCAGLAAAVRVPAIGANLRLGHNSPERRRWLQRRAYHEQRSARQQAVPLCPVELFDLRASDSRNANRNRDLGLGVATTTAVFHSRTGLRHDGRVCARVRAATRTTQTTDRRSPAAHQQAARGPDQSRAVGRASG